jgi:hypothetical protein
MRWSIRKSLEMGPWQSKYPRYPIQDGDEVYLFCHSLMLGLFRDPGAPPRVRSPVCRSTKFPTQIKAFTAANNWSWAQTYDEGRTQGADTNQVVWTSAVAGNTVAAEARQHPVLGNGVDSKPWLGALDKGVAEAHSGIASEDVATLRMFGASLDAINSPMLNKFAGMGPWSDMLTHMANDDFRPARCRVRFAERWDAYLGR